MVAGDVGDQSGVGVKILPGRFNKLVNGGKRRTASVSVHCQPG